MKWRHCPPAPGFTAVVVEAVLVVVTAVLVRIPVLVLGVVVLLHLHLGVAGLTPFFRSGGSGSRPVARGCGQGDWSDLSNSRKRHTPEQVVRKLGQADRMLADGSDIAAVCRELGISEQGA